jgi:hypothetical protein
MSTCESETCAKTFLFQRELIFNFIFFHFLPFLAKEAVCLEGKRRWGDSFKARRLGVHFPLLFLFLISLFSLSPPNSNAENTTMPIARVYADANIKRPKDYWDYDVVSFTWGYVSYFIRFDVCEYGWMDGFTHVHTRTHTYTYTHHLCKHAIR